MKVYILVLILASGAATFGSLYFHVLGRSPLA